MFCLLEEFCVRFHIERFASICSGCIYLVKKESFSGFSNCSSHLLIAVEIVLLTLNLVFSIFWFDLSFNMFSKNC